MAKHDWYNQLTEEFMGRGYFYNDESIQDRINTIAKKVGNTFSSKEIEDRVREYTELGWFVIPTPVWTNYGTNRGAGISCFNTHISDNVESIMKGLAEIGMLSKIGGGTSGYFGDIRANGTDVSTGGKADGPLYFLELYNAVKSKINQGSARRGEFAATINIEHIDYKEWLTINREGSIIQRQPWAVSLSDEWIEDMIFSSDEKRELWAKTLECRAFTGFPYILYVDNANKDLVDVFKDLKLKIKSSNMCTEIMLPSNDEYSFVCDLMGMNLTKYDEWKDTDAVRIAVYFADAVLTDFIEKYENNPLIQRSIKFAKDFRALGIGASGYHSYLQSKNIPIESIQARALNKIIFKQIKEQSYEASNEMFKIYGASEIMSKYKRRHATLNAIAPNTSSSFIIGQHSQSIEPFVSNYYIKNLAKSKVSVKNPYLTQLLEEKNQNTTEVWTSILKQGGSVQHLDFLSQDEKDVYKTFGEISQLELIIQAADRQKFIDQAQSLNLMIHPDTSLKDVNKLYIEAWKLGIKTLYYQLTTNAAQEFNRNLLTCELCAG